MDNLLEKYRILINDSDYKGQIEINTIKDEFFLLVKDFHPNFFTNSIYFIKCQLEYKGKIIVKPEIRFVSSIFDEYRDFSSCVFESAVIFINCLFNKVIVFNNSQFLSSVSFENSKFRDNVRFQYVTFREPVNFKNTSFNKLVDFYYAYFKSAQQFYLTDFLDITIFSNVIFEGQVQFLYTKTNTNSIVSFESAIFYHSLDISRANFWCILSFWGAEFYFNCDEFGLYQFDDVRFFAKAHNQLALQRLRESLRIIKQVFRNEGNNIEAIEIHKAEMFIFDKEHKIKGNNKNWEDKVVLFFNKYSNFFGTSWVRGIGFTALIALFFYIVFLLLLSNELEFDFSFDSFSTTIKYYFQFLNIAIWDYAPFGISNYNWAYLILFIGRIFIGYGYYQIIQAFRKYGKN